MTGHALSRKKNVKQNDCKLDINKGISGTIKSYIYFGKYLENITVDMCVMR